MQRQPADTPTKYDKRLFRECLLSLIKAHRLLISSSIVACLLFAIRQGVGYADSGNINALLRTICAVLIMAALGIYLHSIRNR